MAAAITISMPHTYYKHVPRRSFALLAALLLLSGHAGHAAVLKLGWDPSSDSSIAGYNLSYGTIPGRYTQTLNAGNSTSATVTSLIPGTTYYFVVTSYDTSGLQSLPSNEVSLTMPDNVPPSVSLTSPQGGSSFNTGSPITLTATASDSDGTVVKVEFYQDTNKIGESTSAPYSATWNNAPSGNFVLTALAYDDGGLAVRSAGASISVVAPNAPAAPTPPAPTAPAPPAPTLPPPNVGKVKVATVTPLIRAGAVAQFLILGSQVDMTQPTMINYALGGTATAGVDYSMDGVTGQVMIPTGGRGAVLPLATMPGARGAKRKTVVLQVVPGTGYTPARGNAVVKIIGH